MIGIMFKNEELNELIEDGEIGQELLPQLEFIEQNKACLIQEVVDYFFDNEYPNMAYFVGEVYKKLKEEVGEPEDEEEIRLKGLLERHELDALARFEELGYRVDSIYVMPRLWEYLKYKGDAVYVGNKENPRSLKKKEFRSKEDLFWATPFDIVPLRTKRKDGSRKITSCDSTNIESSYLTYISMDSVLLNRLYELKGKFLFHDFRHNSFPHHANVLMKLANGLVMPLDMEDILRVARKELRNS